MIHVKRVLALILLAGLVFSFVPAIRELVWFWPVVLTTTAAIIVIIFVRAEFNLTRGPLGCCRDGNEVVQRRHEPT